MASGSLCRISIGIYITKTFSCNLFVSKRADNTVRFIRARFTKVRALVAGHGRIIFFIGGWTLGIAFRLAKVIIRNTLGTDAFISKAI